MSKLCVLCRFDEDTRHSLYVEAFSLERLAIDLGIDPSGSNFVSAPESPYRVADAHANHSPHTVDESNCERCVERVRASQPPVPAPTPPPSPSADFFERGMFRPSGILFEDERQHRRPRDSATVLRYMRALDDTFVLESMLENASSYCCQFGECRAAFTSDRTEACTQWSLCRFCRRAAFCPRCTAQWRCSDRAMPCRNCALSLRVVRWPRWLSCTMDRNQPRIADDELAQAMNIEIALAARNALLAAVAAAKTTA